MGVITADRVHRDAAKREPGGQHRGEAGELAGEVVVRVRDRRLVGRIAVAVAERLQRTPNAVHLRRHPARARENGIAGGQVAESAERGQGRLLNRVAHAGDPEGEVLGLLHGRDRHPRRGEGGRQVAVEAQSLERVVVGAGRVQEAAHPAKPR